MTVKNKELEEFRIKIDKIDHKILELLETRMKIVKEVGDFKSKKNDKFFIKSAREADMINNLITKASKDIFPETILGIWRKIITNANLLEQEIKIALHNPEKTNDYIHPLREYYNDLVPINNFENASNIIHSLQKNEHQIAAFSLPKYPNHPNNNNWWIYFAANNDIKIFGKTSFAKKSCYESIDLVLAANKNIEKSQSDNTLSVIEFEKNKVSKNDIIHKLEELGFKFKILDKSNLVQIPDIDFYLIEFENFIDMENEKLNQFIESDLKPFVRIIGYYSN
jgi:chorismate mutase